MLRVDPGPVAVISMHASPLGALGRGENGGGNLAVRRLCEGLAESGEWLGVPADLSGRGTALVSALVHPCPNFRIWASDPQRFGLPEVPDTEDAGFPPGVHPVVRRLWRMMQQDRGDRPGLSELVKSVPSHVLAGAKHPVAGRSGEMWLWPTGAEWDWPGEEWLDISAYATPAKFTFGRGSVYCTKSSATLCSPPGQVRGVGPPTR